MEVSKNAKRALWAALVAAETRSTWGIVHFVRDVRGLANGLGAWCCGVI